MTDCTPAELRAQGPGRREIVARFDGGSISSDAGVLLLGAVEQRRHVLRRLAGCFVDHRDPCRVEHTVQEIVAQRVLAIALGYEDVNDHEVLRLDPLLAAVVGKLDPTGRSRRHQGSLAAPATIHRLELSHPGLAEQDRYCRIGLDQSAADNLLIDLFIEAHEEPEEIVLDLDATDDAVHGKQDGRFFHGYYDHYCFLPLYIFAGDHLLCARLRKADRDAADGCVEELERIVSRIRAAWPSTRIIVRADSGFCRDWLMTWCEEQNVEYVLGMAKNERLKTRLAGEMREAEALYGTTRKPARVFKDFRYKTRTSWSRRRRVVGKAEHLQRGANPRFVVTSLSAKEWDARALYEDLYCARGEMENRIKEQQLDLFADRTSCNVFRANQVRLYFSSFAYVLLNELRRLGLEGTEMARAQCGTIRLKLLKIGARVRVTVRKVWVAMSESHPCRDLFVHAWHRLRPA
jgi:hypothetical protein